MKKFLLPTLLIAMFALPGIASAANAQDVKGPLVIAGKGFLRGELKMENPAESRPFAFGVKGGYIGIIDKKGDLKVRCQGFEETAVEETEEGKVYFCMGERGRALVRGSHFAFRAFGVLYKAHLPEGTSGQLTGRFVQCGKPADGSEEHPRLCGRPDEGDRGTRGERPEGDRGNGPADRGNGPADRGNGGNNGERNRGAGNGNGKGNTDNLPSLAELAALLTAQK